MGYDILNHSIPKDYWITKCREAYSIIYWMARKLHLLEQISLATITSTLNISPLPIQRDEVRSKLKMSTIGDKSSHEVVQLALL